MKQFAKLFEVEGRQVLVYLEPGGPADFVLHQITHIDTSAGPGIVDIEQHIAIEAQHRDSSLPYEFFVGGYGDEKLVLFLDTIRGLEGRLPS